MPAVTFRHSTHPEQPELRRLDRLIDEHVVRRSSASLAAAGGDLTCRLPARRRHAHDDDAEHHEDEIDAAQRDERLEHADVGRGGELLISHTESGEAIIAPPPKPMIAMPVAMPGRSGNHLISVETGEM